MIAPESTRSQVISPDLTGNVGNNGADRLRLQHSLLQPSGGVHLYRYHRQRARLLQFSLLRCIAVSWRCWPSTPLRPQSSLWHRRCWQAMSVTARVRCYRDPRRLVVVVPFWEPGNTGLATEKL